MPPTVGIDRADGAAGLQQRLGFTNIVLDPGGVVRRGLLYADDGRGGVGTSLALQLALLYLGKQDIQPRPDPEDAMALMLGGARFAPLDAGFGGYSEVDAGGFQYPLDFRDSPAEVPGVRLAALLAQRFPRGTFDDRIVLIDVPPGEERRFEWCKRVKELSDTTKVALLLHHPSRQRVTQAFLSRADIILGFPCEEQQLSAKLRQVMAPAPSASDDASREARTDWSWHDRQGALRGSASGGGPCGS